MKQNRILHISRKVFFIMTTLSVLLFTGCGENNGAVNGETTMVVGASYTVSSGDTITPSGDAQIIVTHTLSDGTKTVQLVSGTATLLRGSYGS